MNLEKVKLIILITRPGQKIFTDLSFEEDIKVLAIVGLCMHQ